MKQKIVIFVRTINWEYTVTGIVFGMVAFGLFVLYDLNSVLWKRRWMHPSFLTGCVLLLLSTVLQICSALKTVQINVSFITFFILSLLFFGLMIYTLFFALPFEKTYMGTDEKPQVYDQGMYALCRHPGVLWFFFFYLFLGLALRPSHMLRNGMIYSLLNLFYIIMQDFWTFPKTFADYGTYKEKTPFLIPTRVSVKRALRRK